MVSTKPRPGQFYEVLFFGTSTQKTRPAPTQKAYLSFTNLRNKVERTT